MSCPVCSANILWICGDLLWAMGLPMTAYLSVMMMRFPLLALQPVRRRDRPRARDGQDVGIGGDVRGQRGVRRGEFDDADRCRVQYAVARGFVHFHAFHAAILEYRHAQLESSKQLLAARLLRVIQIADAFDFDAPILN